MLTCNIFLYVTSNLKNKGFLCPINVMCIKFMYSIHISLAPGKKGAQVCFIYTKVSYLLIFVFTIDPF